jgi:hypothetical protein
LISRKSLRYVCRCTSQQGSNKTSQKMSLVGKSCVWLGVGVGWGLKRVGTQRTRSRSCLDVDGRVGLAREGNILLRCGSAPTPKSGGRVHSAPISLPSLADELEPVRAAADPPSCGARSRLHSSTGLRRILRQSSQLRTDPQAPSLAAHGSSNNGELTGGTRRAGGAR